MQDHHMEYRNVTIDYGEDFNLTVKIYCNKNTSQDDAIMLAKSKLHDRLKHEVTPMAMLGVNMRVFEHHSRLIDARKQAKQK